MTAGMTDSRIAKLPAGSALKARAAMASRIVTAIVGGYAAASGLAALAARLMPIDRAEATAWAMITSFAVYGGLILWAFREPRLPRVAGVIWGLALLAGGATWLIGRPA
jgi:hypothetical protein